MRGRDRDSRYAQNRNKAGKGLTQRHQDTKRNMSERIVLGLCLVAAAGLVALAVLEVSEDAQEPAPAPYLVRRVIDGDTFEIEDPWGLRTRVRLRRLNAPELDQPGGPEAKIALEARLLGRRIHLKVHARDRYGRVIATVRP